MRSIRTFIHYETTEEPWGGSNSFLCALKKYLMSRNDIDLTSGRNMDFDIMLLNTSVTAPGKHTSIRQIKRVKSYGYLSLFQYALSGFKKRKVSIVLRLDGLKRFYADLPLVKGDCIQLELTKFADAIIFQSEESRDQFKKLIEEITVPHFIINNGVNQSIFNMNGKIFWNKKDKLKIFTTSWSSNPRKGFDDIARMSNLDGVIVNFVGHWPDVIAPGNVHIKPPVPQRLLAEEYKKNDILFFPSRNEACPNVVYEGLSCGLPLIYHPSGGTPEIAADYGVALSSDLIFDLQKITDNYDLLVRKIIDDQHIFSIDYAGSRYVEVLKKVVSVEKTSVPLSSGNTVTSF